MKIGLNAQLLSLSGDYRATGINWYIFHLLRHLPKAGKGQEFIAYTGEEKAPRLLPGIDFRLTRLPTRNPLVRILWEQFILPFHLAKDKVDLIHSLGFVLPLASNRQGVVTVFDLGFILYPQAHKPWRRIYLSALARISARKAKHIIAISESTKADIEKLWDISGEKISVIYLGVDDALYHDADPTAITRLRKAHRLPEKMVLTLGTIEPRKNFPTLLQAYSQLKKDGLEHTLVVAGAPGWGASEVYAQVEQLGLMGRVVFTGYIPNENLPALYQAAELFVYPSLHEGFGLPPLEAMAAGTPTIVSRTSSLPEVVGDAAITVEPTNSEELASEIKSVLMDPELRTELRAKGRERARFFTWERTARETIVIYERVVGE